MQRGDVPLAHRLFPRRLGADGLDGQVGFDEASIGVHGDKTS